jgi:hypothetical protein
VCLPPALIAAGRAFLGCTANDCIIITLFVPASIQHIHYVLFDYKVVYKLMVLLSHGTTSMDKMPAASNSRAGCIPGQPGCF